MASGIENTASRINFDSTFCGSIPLNFINQVQPHGVLLVLNKDHFNVLQVSENAEQFLKLPAGDIVGQDLSHFIGDEQQKEFVQKVQRQAVSNQYSHTLSWSTGEEEKQFLAIVHPREDYLLMELEEIADGRQANSFVSIYEEISYVIAALKKAENLQALGQIASTELKKLSGFDRVMLYQFDQQWNGTVVAEAMEEGMNSYLGLRFPASDVPKPARDLYSRTPYRIIPDVQAKPVKLYPVVNPDSNSLTDIADCILRGVPLVHIEYLQNMGVAASMSTPVIVDNRLWGLISCHHSQPKPVSFEARSSFEIISGIISAQLSALEKEESFTYRTELYKTELKLVEQLYTKKSIQEALFEKPSYLTDLFGVSGLVLVLGKNYETAGEVPGSSMVKNLVKWLSRYNKEKVFTTDSLPRIFEEAEEYRHVASGLIALQITAGKSYLLGFRPEVIRSVHWGGNPNEAIQFEENEKQYHPRNSFKIWKEQLEYSSEAWQPELLETARNVRTAILEKIIRENET